MFTQCKAAVKWLCVRRIRNQIRQIFTYLRRWTVEQFSFWDGSAFTGRNEGEGGMKECIREILSVSM